MDQKGGMIMFYWQIAVIFINGLAGLITLYNAESREKNAKIGATLFLVLAVWGLILLFK